MRRVVVVVVALIIGVVTAAVAVAASPGADVRLTNDEPGTGGTRRTTRWLPGSRTRTPRSANAASRAGARTSLRM